MSIVNTKKLIIGAGAMVLLLGVATAGYAAERATEPQSYPEMRPYMEEMHPDMNDSELERMYDSCHQENQDGSMHGSMNQRSMRGHSNID